MSWKNKLPFFAWQTIIYSNSLPNFKTNWSNYTRWKQSLSPERNSVADESAWINFEALDFLSNWLKPSHRIFEFGGGGSTLFFLKQAQELVVTVENNQDWFKRLEQTIHQKNYTHWKGILQDGEPFTGNIHRSIEEPLDYLSNAKGAEQLTFEKYAKSINQYPDGFFDLILVDGRARPSCIFHAIPHLKKGGLLVIDNNDRAYYSAQFKQQFQEEFETLLNNQSAIPYIPDFVKTTILKKK